MSRACLLILLVCFALFGCRQRDTNVHLDKTGKRGYEVKIKIPTQWIDKLRAFKYNRDTKGLLREFEGFIKPDTIAHNGGNHVDDDYGRLVNPMFVNLDSGPEDELITFLGWDVYSPYLCVFKQQNGTWYLIYIEQFRTFYDTPVLQVANNFSPNKVFYFEKVDGHGSGYLASSYSFYKLINDKIYKCLDLIDNMHAASGNEYDSYEITTKFEFDGDETDEIGVTYKYSSLIDFEGTLRYAWNKKNHIYQPEFSKDTVSISYSITDKHLAFFNEPENHKLFLSTFKKQIDDVLKNGTAHQKKILTENIKKIHQSEDK